jgi:hypothetical protein
MRHRPLLTILMSITIASGVVLGSSATAEASGWAQFGGRVAAWHTGHAPDPKGCSSGPCFGPRVHSGAQPFEFTHVTTDRGRVDGYDQGLANGTSQTEAELRALSLMPSDTTMGTVAVHHDRFGQSCAYVNFQSTTLKAWFGANFLAGSGTVGIELVTVNGQGHVTYDPTDVNLAIVAPIPLGSDDNC